MSPLGGPRRPHRYGPGDSFCFPGAGLHRMYHDTGAVTIHVYSPPLRAIGYYEVSFPASGISRDRFEAVTGGRRLGRIGFAAKAAIAPGGDKTGQREGK
jgi:hypothetical protein